MDTHPPFQMEDQTDEDFFDKLVDDDDDLKLNTYSTQSFLDGSDSDELKAFANLSIGEVGTESTIESDKKDVKAVSSSVAHVDADVRSSVSVNSFGIDSVDEQQKENSGLEITADSLGSGVKELQWSAFNSDSEVIAGHGFGSNIDFFNEIGDGAIGSIKNMDENPDKQSKIQTPTEGNSILNKNTIANNQTNQDYMEISNQPDVNSIEYWESMYPGWKYDPNTGQWYQVNENGGTENLQATTDSTIMSTTSWNDNVSKENGATESISNWTAVSEGNNSEYPTHMIFDPQYPGWYYDMIVQEWRTLESYTSSIESTIPGHDQINQNWNGSTSNSYDVSKSQASGSFGENQQTSYGSNLSFNNTVRQQNSYDSNGTVFQDKGNSGFSGFSPIGAKAFGSSGNLSQHTPSSYYDNQNSVNFSREQFKGSPQFSSPYSAERSSAGRPPHALATFGFGGKLIVMKTDDSFSNASYGKQSSVGGSFSILNLMDVLSKKPDASTAGVDSCEYFNTICRQSFPGPLIGGNIGGKDLNKWVDERIVNCASLDNDFQKVEALRLLLSLLKIACLHYGKLRSPLGTDHASKDGDAPETAVARLFASAKGTSVQFTDYGTLSNCFLKSPSEGQMQDTAAEVQSLLVSGKKREALQCACEGQLWGPALVLAAQLGDQFYVDTVKKMALHQLAPGSPLRTLCLLIAGQPADIFSAETTPNSGFHAGTHMSVQPSQRGSNGMLDEWKENLALITANRTKDDELVLIHLGDCLWKDRSDIIAAHICYLVAEANFEAYSDTARLCLIGSDHWKFPRTYASPDAIQRTEFYEYIKVLGNSQFILLPFQPYKLIYAFMLAEIGKVSESLKYCHAISKSLRTGRSVEVETWRQLVTSLEERIRTHQQGGYSTNLAPGKLVGKLLNLFDNTAQRVVGGLPPPAPSATHGNLPKNDDHFQAMGHRVSSSQSTMAMSSLMPSSASMEPINEWTGDGSKMTVHNRSVSEPDFGRSPRQADSSSKQETSPNTQTKAVVASGGISRFGRLSFGSQLFQKTVGLVLRPRQDKQLKRWVEEGVEPPAEETAPPPPPTTTKFQNGGSDYNLRSSLNSEASLSNGSLEFKSPSHLEHNSGIPPIPTTSNQFSARGRMGVRSRYVDTFNNGGGNPTKQFQSPSLASVKPPVTGFNPKFFVPTPVSSSEQTFIPTIEENESINEGTVSAATTDNSFRTHEPMTMQRFASMDNVANKQTATTTTTNSSSYSRRTASWSGSFSDKQNQTFTPSNHHPSPVHLPRNGSGFGDDLHEVEL
ncbi:protein transport protein SEC16B homolog isoform X2 [Impatiens glandulifera]|uniref:protein transport protein SEC16B homolog isoform X2 n=1 Tax=Impatiens glandulifera TaxID=253017 RepID=UPI001FB1875C|nr:protein transport protein SEC16B homolog isoform X2 [Impatiens glandulifera]